nr:hypothetical protein [Tanacetum cinerariifolium]
MTNAPAEQAHAIAPPTRTDDQILPSSNWVPIGKSNCVLDVQKSQRNPIFPICQLDEQWFNLHKDILRDALDITPTNDNNPFVAPPSSDTVIKYVNTLGYLSTLRNVSAMSVNVLYQPWRAILSMINMCLTGKTAGFDRPRHPVLQILWGIIHISNINYAERIWEEFVQSIQTFITNRKNLATASRRKKKSTHILISSIRFTKLIIYHLKTKHNIHPRSGSPLHYSYDESILNTLREYQENVAKYQQHLDAEHGKATEEGETVSFKATKVTKPKAAKATKPASDPKPKLAPTQPPKVVPQKKQKLVQETPDEPSPAKRSKGGQVSKIRKPMSSLKLVDQPSAEDVSVKEPAYNEKEANLQWALDLILKEQVQKKGKEKVVEEQDAHDLFTLQTLKNKSLVDQFIFQRHTPMPAEASRPAKSPSLDAELPLPDSETEFDDEVHKINTGDQDEGQVGPNPGVQDEGQAGSNPSDDQLDEEFTKTAYPNVQENLKLPSEDPVIPEEPASSTGTLSSLQNLKKELSFTDQFVMEKQHKEEPDKTNAEAEVQSMVLVPIHQDTSLVPPMTTLVIDLMTSQSGSLLPTSSKTTSTVMTTTTIPLPPH